MTYSLPPPPSVDRRTRRREGRTDAKGEGEPRVHATEFLLPREGVVGRRATSICLVRLPHQERPRIPRASITSSSYQPRRRTAPVCSTLYAAHPPTYTYTVPLHPSRPIPHNIPPSPSVPSLEEQPGAFARYALGPGNRIRGIYVAILAKTTRFSQPGKSRRREGSVEPFNEFEINIG